MIPLFILLATFVSPLQRDLSETDSNTITFTYDSGNVTLESIRFVDGMLKIVWIQDPAFSTIPPQPTHKYRETYEVTDDGLELVKLEMWIVERIHHVANGVATTTVRRYWQEISTEGIQAPPLRLEVIDSDSLTIDSDILDEWIRPNRDDRILLQDN
jgi:hypothetical protein